MDTTKYNRAEVVNGVKIITKHYIDNVLRSATELERYRDQIIIHDKFSEKPQRFVNCLTRKSYVRPHLSTYQINLY